MSHDDRQEEEASWLDSWRNSQLFPGDNFLDGGWSEDSYEEHAAVMNWALSTESNGALNLRIPVSTMRSIESFQLGYRESILFFSHSDIANYYTLFK